MAGLIYNIMRFPSFRKKEKTATPPVSRPEKTSFPGFLSRKPPAGKAPCPKCGVLNPDNVNYCKDCGSPYPGRSVPGPSAGTGAAVPADEPKVWLEKGNALFRQGQFAGAAECYTKALARDPAYAKALNNKALALEKMGRAEEARACRQELSALTAKGR